MRLLKTHSHTFERRGNKADKVRQKERKKGRSSPKGQESGSARSRVDGMGTVRIDEAARAEARTTGGAVAAVGLVAG